MYNAHEVIEGSRESAVNLVAGGSGSLCRSELGRADDLNIVGVTGAAGERHGLDDTEDARRDCQIGVSASATSAGLKVATEVPVVLAVACPLAGGRSGGGHPVRIADADLAVADDGAVLG